MIAVDEDALICDLAETYHIFDYKAVPVEMLARLSAGLRQDSRSVMAITGTKVSEVEIMLAGILDRLSQLVWMQTADAQHGKGRPESIVEMLLNDRPSEGASAIRAFNSPEEFEAALVAAKGGEDHSI